MRNATSNAIQPACSTGRHKETTATPYIDAGHIKAPLQAHWATQDEFFPIASVDALQEKLLAAGVNFEFHRYLARHAFANETAVGPGRIPATQYDPVWSQQAWDRTLRFLGRALG